MIGTLLKYAIVELSIDNLYKTIQRRFIRLFNDPTLENIVTIEQWKKVIDCNIGESIPEKYIEIISITLHKQNIFNKTMYLGGIPIFQQYTLPIIRKHWSSFNWNYTYNPVFFKQIPIHRLSCGFGDAEAALTMEICIDTIISSIGKRSINGLLIDFHETYVDIYI